MAHPKGGAGSSFDPKHSFAKVYAYVGTQGVYFHSTTGEQI